MIVLANTDEHVRNLPVSLTPELVEDPYPVLEWFFYPGDIIPKYREWMAYWYIDAIKSPQKMKARTMLKAIYNFSSMAKLMDALWIIYKQGDTFTPEDIAVRGNIDDYELHWSDRTLDNATFFNYRLSQFFPEHLEIEDKKNPYSVIAEFFSDKDLFDAKARLEWWLSCILNNKGQHTTEEQRRLLVIHNQTMKVLEIVFIIVEIRLLKRSDSTLPI